MISSGIQRCFGRKPTKYGCLYYGQRRFAAIAVLAGGVLLTAFFSIAQTPALNRLNTAEEVRRLSPEEAARHYPVHLRGVVTVFDQTKFARVVQDGTAGIYLGDPGNLPLLKAGEIVEIDGVSYPGEYAPILQPGEIRIVGESPLPQPKTVTFDSPIGQRQGGQPVRPDKRR